MHVRNEMGNTSKRFYPPSVKKMKHHTILFVDTLKVFNECLCNKFKVRYIEDRNKCMFFNFLPVLNIM